MSGKAREEFVGGTVALAVSYLDGVRQTMAFRANCSSEAASRRHGGADATAAQRAGAQEGPAVEGSMEGVNH